MNLTAGLSDFGYVRSARNEKLLSDLVFESLRQEVSCSKPSIDSLT